MANPQNVELEAAKFLHKLIQESKDEPSKLATKLYVILQHMRSSGKENSMPYQVISRAMETVIKDHNLDIETLMSSRLPLAAGTQIGDSASQQLAGTSQCVGTSKESKSGNEITTPEAYASTRTHSGPVCGGQDMYQGSAAHTCGSYLPADSSNRMQFGNSSFDGHGLAAKMSKDRSVEGFPFSDHSAGTSLAGKTLDHGGSSVVTNANMSSFQGSLAGPNVTRTAGSRDTGKSPVPQASNASLPFKEQQLKQLRAQCLVFLAFRNGLMPKKLHLEIALGNMYSKEDGIHRDLVDQKGKEQLVHDHSGVPEIQRSLERPDSSKGHLPLLNSNTPKEADHVKFSDERIRQPAVLVENDKDRKYSVTRGKTDAEITREEAIELRSSVQREPHDSSMPETFGCDHEDDLGNFHQRRYTSSAVMTPVEQSMLQDSGSSVNEFADDIANLPVSTTSVTNEGVLLRPEENPMGCNNLGMSYSDKTFPSFPLKDKWKPVSGMSGQNYPAMPIKDSNATVRNFYQETDHEEGYASLSMNKQPSPKHTTVEKWILDRQKRKVLAEVNWAQKQQKTAQKITACSDRLKEIVSSSEDISAKTKSVIELKKLQLLELQRRLRSDILNDFFKPLANEMDRLKSIKKHRIGRRSKQMERYEQKMKEERQRRIRERQKEFFSEIEVYRERLEDGFKVKRERVKGFNRYVREFHKRKERLHREKIDRIQREKINLLKINDVEGYLRMVQDAKSDRVNKLLKETEKYLQKLGSRLKDAKTMTGQFKTDIEASKGSSIEESEDVENEDEMDQAKHYLESNEKYYTMAHSVKETIADQPTCLVGGKLREYQMNGLRWLVSLYNNHLNGILADEMGLGKTVQVISLICYLMETKNDRGPFLVVVPSSVLPGWESEINLWAPSVHKIVYCGPPEERRRLFKEHIVHQKFNVLLTTYEYLMNKHDRPKLSKIHWHYVIIDEGHRIKNASCKLNAELKHYRSHHRLLLTGTPLQNNLEELWALLNFLLPNIFNSSEDFSQWFNKPFQGNGDNSADEALLSEEENLLIINRLHQVLRPFVLRRLKHKVENELPEKIERLIRCEASAYQKLLMKRVEDNLGAIGTSKARSVHNSVMELRNICNHPYLSQLHVEEVHDLIPKHYLPSIIRLCGKLEMLDRLLPKLKATDHRVLLFSTMTRLLDVMEDYLCWKKYRYLRLDGHTSGGDRGALIEKFNNPDSPYFIFLLSIRAGGVGVNLQAADTVIIFDTDWNPQVDLQAQARAHRIGQKKDVLVIRLETVQTVEEQVRASAEHKLGVANQSITAGFFDNNTSAEDRREYLESLLRECKKEEAAPVLDDDSLNYIIARSESEIDVFESVDKQRFTDEMVVWQGLCGVKGLDKSKHIPPLPSRLLTDDDLKSFYEVMKISDAPASSILPDPGLKRKSGYLGGLDTQQYGRGKRAREVRSYEEQWTEEEFEKLCQANSPESPTIKEEGTGKTLLNTSNSTVKAMGDMQAPAVPQLPQLPTVEPLMLQNKEVTTPSKRGRGRPKRVVEVSSAVHSPLQPEKAEEVTKLEPTDVELGPDSLACTTHDGSFTGSAKELKLPATPYSGPPIPPVIPASQVAVSPSSSGRGRGRGRKSQIGGEAPAPRRRGKRQTSALQTVQVTSLLPVTDNLPIGIQELSPSSATATNSVSVTSDTEVVETDLNSASPAALLPSAPVPSSDDVGPQLGDKPGSSMASDNFSSGLVPVANVNQADAGTVPTLNPQASPLSVSGVAVTQPTIPSPSITTQGRGRGRGRGRGQNAQSREEAPQRRRRRQEPVVSIVSGSLTSQDLVSTEPQPKRTRASVGRNDTVRVERGQEVSNASKYAGQDSAVDAEIGTGKVQVPPKEQVINEKPNKDQGDEVLTSKSNLSDNLPSISTSAPAARASSSLVTNPAGKGEVSYNNAELDIKEPFVDGSVDSESVLSQTAINCGTSEDSQSLEATNISCAVVEKDQGFNSGGVEAATATFGSLPLGDEVNKFDHTCKSKDDGIFGSTERPNSNEFPPLDNLSKDATEDDPLIPVSELSDRRDDLIAFKDTQASPECVTKSIHVDSAGAPSSLPGEIGNYGSPSGHEDDEIIDSSRSSNLNAPLVSDKLFDGQTSNSISGITKSTEEESGKVEENKQENNISVAIPVSTDFHVDCSATITSTILVPVRTTIEEVSTEPDAVSPAAIPSSALSPSNVVESEQGVVVSSLMASVHGRTNLMAVTSSDQLGPDIFPMSTVEATEKDIVNPSAGEVPKGFAKDASYDVDSLDDPLQDKETKEKEGNGDNIEVLASEYVVSNNSPSVSTLDAAVGDLSSIGFKSGNLTAGDCEESDSKDEPGNQDHCGGNSDDNHRTTEDFQLEKHSNSIELENNRSLNSCTVGADRKLTSTLLPAVNDKFDSPNQKEADKIILSSNNPAMDESLASDNLSEKPTEDASFGPVPQFSDSQNVGVVTVGDTQTLPIDSNPVAMVKEDLAIVNVQAVPVLGSLSLPDALSPCRKGLEKITESRAETYTISVITEGNKNIVGPDNHPTNILGENENNCTPAVDSAVPAEEHEIGDSKEVALDPEPLTSTITMSDESFPNNVGLSLREIENLAMTETGNLDMRQNVGREECGLHTSVDAAANAEKDDKVIVQGENDHVKVLLPDAAAMSSLAPFPDTNESDDNWMPLDVESETAGDRKEDEEIAEVESVSPTCENKTKEEVSILTSEVSGEEVVKDEDVKDKDDLDPTLED